MDPIAPKRTLSLPLLVALLLLLAVGPLLVDRIMCALGTKAFTVAPGDICYRGGIDLESGTGKALLRHEAVHQRQMREYGLVRFWAFYVCEHFDLPGEYPELEKEAKRAETEEWLACRHIDFGSKPPWSTDEGGLPWLDRQLEDVREGTARVVR
jgi:hypothetical protein